jgi:hypothetical protein
MRLAQDAWNKIDTMAIQIYRPNLVLIHPTDALNSSDVDPAAYAKTLVKTALDDLEATWALQR